MKKEIYITIFLLALMLFALAVTVVGGPESPRKVRVQVIIKDHRIVTNCTTSDINPILEIPNNNRATGVRVDVCPVSIKLFKTGFAGCELEQQILVRAAPFTRLSL
jgi:hypothetical protein